ncbi:MAG: methionine--tRNA ligase subunit beta [Candidatus Eisenbacteria bacterium]|nr:methionine--tRNA ligase subunit beta [Candidatus Eisenbacteria bacterium]
MSQPQSPKPEITIEDFAKLDLRTARILRVEPHPNADKLLKMAIDIGGEERQIVAGIAPYYRSEDLLGKSIVVVANLKPVKLRGEWSHGMLLAASGGDRVVVLAPASEIPPGSPVS